MPDTALTTRVSDETFRRLKLASAYYGRSIQDIVEAALRVTLDQLEIARKARGDA